MQLYKLRHIFYSHLHKYEDEFTNIMNHTMMQYMLKVGIRQYKERRKKGVAAKMKQLHYKMTFKPFREKFLTAGQRSNVLHALMFPKENRTEQIKGRMCADSRKR